MLALSEEDKEALLQLSRSWSQGCKPNVRVVCDSRLEFYSIFYKKKKDISRV
jgi:hypothetical protein